MPLTPCRRQWPLRRGRPERERKVPCALAGPSDPSGSESRRPSSRGPLIRGGRRLPGAETQPHALPPLGKPAGGGFSRGPSLINALPRTSNFEAGNRELCRLCSAPSSFYIMMKEFGESGGGRRGSPGISPGPGGRRSAGVQEGPLWSPSAPRRPRACGLALESRGSARTRQQPAPHPLAPLRAAKGCRPERVCAVFLPRGDPLWLD